MTDIFPRVQTAIDGALIQTVEIGLHQLRDHPLSISVLICITLFFIYFYKVQRCLFIHGEYLERKVLPIQAIIQNRTQLFKHIAMCLQFAFLTLVFLLAAIYLNTTGSANVRPV